MTHLNVAKKAFVGVCIILEVLCISEGVQSLLYHDPMEDQGKDAPLSALEIPYFCPVAVSRLLVNSRMLIRCADSSVEDDSILLIQVRFCDRLGDVLLRSQRQLI
ncbi:hypothetical protein ASPSYDRAFT_38194 [Aspergillus sydowii CBS 593.65]|uniref:Secreted protein n=1 Tax=Aspergillus sydowii CBS 593.65 TaxID=1036612 RepID=A0A1L9TW14_9EURO|nr:uncharacterized protein ASPSYDRAFT_38194 [Aspergillus sydowii CBS 593.65]OJJ63606.1 hypothetical protein ASPSYDRAFT_38194 [Aspergillus sydowii CBS 593.65]